MKKLIISICLLIFCSKGFALNPSRTYPVMPETIGLTKQVFKIKITDKIQLHSWVFVQKDRNKPFVIISNSDGGNMGYCLAQAHAFFSGGYNVVLYDYRGFGESSDFQLNKNMMYYDEFADDLRATVAFVKQQYKTDSIVLYGISMGTIISDIVMQEDLSIKGGIFDSFSINPKLVAQRVFTKKNKTVLLPDGAENYIAGNKKKLRVPVLLFSGLKDQMTRSTDYTDFLLLNKESKMVTWDCDHIECVYAMSKDSQSDLYIKEIKSYINSLNI